MLAFLPFKSKAQKCWHLLAFKSKEQNVGIFWHLNERNKMLAFSGI
jgi:hypothetical protein